MLFETKAAAKEQRAREVAAYATMNEEQRAVMNILLEDFQTLAHRELRARERIAELEYENAQLEMVNKAFRSGLLVVEDDADEEDVYEEDPLTQYPEFTTVE